MTDDRSVTSLRTPLCDLLGIDVPILSVGFGESAGPELVAAVSGAGGLGVLGGGAWLPEEEIRDRVTRVRERTDRSFGVNVIIASLERPGVAEETRAGVRDRIATAIEERVPLLVLFWGDPSAFLAPAHAAGLRIAVQTGSVEESVAAAAAGVDVVIAQGIEAGGHVRATESMWEVLPRTVEAVAPVPVIASGGIGDGVAIARALRLGAQGVSMGTRFVASEEAYVHARYKERLTTATGGDTFYGELFDIGWPEAPHRVLRNKAYEEWDAAGRPPSGKRPGEGAPIGIVRFPWGGEETWIRYESGMLTPGFDGDPEYAPMWAGLSVDAVRDVRPAADIVRDLAREAEAALAT